MTTEDQTSSTSSTVQPAPPAPMPTNEDLPDDAGESGESTTAADLVASYRRAHAAAGETARVGLMAGDPTSGGSILPVDDSQGPLYQPNTYAGEPLAENMSPPVSAVTVAPIAPGGWTGRTMAGSPLQVAAPAPTPRPGDPDLTGWRREVEHDEENAPTMANDKERAEGGEAQDYTVGELVDYLEGLDNVSQLDEAEAAEMNRANGPRPRALRAIQDARDELTSAAQVAAAPHQEHSEER